MGVSNLDEVVIVTRAKERFEYRRGGQPLLCRRESDLSQCRHAGTYLRIGRKKKITIRRQEASRFSQTLRAPIYISMEIK